jgi:Leucine-rich repeat (LRR) protein
MIKLNFFLLLNFFLMIKSENCQNKHPCSCSIETTKNKNEFQLFIFECINILEKIPEIQNIKSININSKAISSFPDNLISNETCFYKNITHLEITNTNLNSIKKSDFKCLSKLEQLVLNLNEITIIDAEVFKNSGEMIQLYLNNNKITDVDQNSFCGLSKLLLLNLNRNYIKSLPENICFPQQIEKLYLSNNQIKSKIL